MTWRAARGPDNGGSFNINVGDMRRVNAVLGWLRGPAATRPALRYPLFRHGRHRGPSLWSPRHQDRRGRRQSRPRGSAGWSIGCRPWGSPPTSSSSRITAWPRPARDRVIALNRIADPSDYRIVESGPYAALDVRPGREAALAAALLRPQSHMQCWRKAAMPARFHYGANARVPPFLCLAAPGWLILSGLDAVTSDRGAHGYDPEAPEMAALFIAHGPAFRRGARLPAFDNVHVYPLLARLLGLPGRPGDGDPSVLAPALAAR